MKFKLIIDPSKEEEVVATVHEATSLTRQIEELILQHTGSDHLTAYAEDEMKLLPFAQIECITVLDGKTFAIDIRNRKYRLRQRLYELETVLPSSFIRINKSSLANERITAVYQTERLPLTSAILLHAGVLYLDYLIMYLLNSWIPRNFVAIGIFTASFILGFVIIWVCIYLSTKAKTDRINSKLHNT